MLKLISMDEQSGISREKQMIHSGQFEEPDWSFLDEWFAHDPKMLAELKAGIAEGKARVRSHIQDEPPVEDLTVAAPAEKIG